jgi:LDH2 family malate/lactate/ureidoglycolate dehydrogenase
MLARLDGGEPMVMVTIFNMGHAGRLERPLRTLARRGYNAFAVMNVQGWGRTTFPLATKGKWGTNPIGFATSTGKGEDGLVIDLATTARAEGEVKHALINGLLVERGVLRNPDGSLEIKPQRLYDAEPALLCALGADGPSPYKGPVLGLGINLFTDTMVGRKPALDEIMLGSNSLVLLGTRPGDPTYELAKEQVDFFRSVKTIDDEPVRMPGEYGLTALLKARMSGLPVAKKTWEELEHLHAEATQKIA